LGEVAPVSYGKKKGEKVLGWNSQRTENNMVHQCEIILPRNGLTGLGTLGNQPDDIWETQDPGRGIIAVFNYRDMHFKSIAQFGQV